MRLEVNDNMFWLGLWLVIGSCTAVTEYGNSKVEVARYEAQACVPDRREQDDE